MEKIRFVLQSKIASKVQLKIGWKLHYLKIGSKLQLKIGRKLHKSNTEVGGVLATKFGGFHMFN